MQLITVTSFLLVATFVPALADPPAISEKAPDFVLSTPGGHPVRLSEVCARGPVALVVLRGYPGYQCPYCNRQVQDFVSHAREFADRGIQVLFVYPGPPQELPLKANEFLTGKSLPENFNLVLDPGYLFTGLYGLRWEAAHETAYPSTFLMDEKGIIFFSKIVKEHGARTTAAEVLDAFPRPKTSRLQ